MRKFVLSLLCLCGLFALYAPCVASVCDTQEQVIVLPQDGGKWYISIVGDNSTTHIRVLRWFRTHRPLFKLMRQVHYWEIQIDSDLYRTRYASNVKGLPTIRLQKPDGTVVYEAAGNKIPATPDKLNSKIRDAVMNYDLAHQALPWRRDMERRCSPNKPCPQPTPEPKPQPQPTPTPAPDDGSAPQFDEEPAPVSEGMPVAAIVGIIAACALLGAGAGLVVQWKRTYSL